MIPTWARCAVPMPGSFFLSEIPACVAAIQDAPPVGLPHLKFCLLQKRKEEPIVPTGFFPFPLNASF